jgi:hypothetical protein
VKPSRRHRLADNHRDANEDPLIALAQQLGGHFHPGPPLDGWLLARGVWLPVEIKLPEREGTGREYTPLQKRFFSWCALHNAPYHIWRDDKDVLRTMGARVSA